MNTFQNLGMVRVHYPQHSRYWIHYDVPLEYHVCAWIAQLLLDGWQQLEHPLLPLPTLLQSARNFAAEEIDACTLDKNHAATKISWHHRVYKWTYTTCNPFCDAGQASFSCVGSCQATCRRTYSLRQNRWPHCHDWASFAMPNSSMGWAGESMASANSSSDRMALYGVRQIGQRESMAQKKYKRLRHYQRSTE